MNKSLNLQKLSDDQLLSETENLTHQERKLLVDLLYHLKEVERRRLFSLLKYSSLFQYMVSHLGYPEDQADRRIAAMRLLKELPALEEKISSGALNLTNIGMARTVFNKKRKSGTQYSKTEKLELLEQLENKSVREAAKVLTIHAPTALAIDKIRVVSQDELEFQFRGPLKLQNKLKQLKGLLAHTNPGISMGELLDKLFDLGIESWSKTQRPQTKTITKERAQPPNFADQTAAPRDSECQKHPSHAATIRAVWKRDQCCTRCGSTYALEIDHRLPRSLGGGDSSENLRVLCRNCNQRAAIEVFGLNKMDPYLNRRQI